jgi:hypothetical protein
VGVRSYSTNRFSIILSNSFTHTLQVYQLDVSPACDLITAFQHASLIFAFSITWFFWPQTEAALVCSETWDAMWIKAPPVNWWKMVWNPVAIT